MIQDDDDSADWDGISTNRTIRRVAVRGVWAA